ncbi:MAG: hypothetical protein SGI73_20825 [Chloroflexota bacterium]|nr:hypothetical protein [Chloroflexota bacterium]
MTDPNARLPIVTDDVYHEDDMDAEAEARWEAEVLRESLGAALLPNGEVDFAILNANTIPITLEELCAECDDKEETIVFAVSSKSQRPI